MLVAGTRSHATRQQEKAQTHRTSSYKPAPCLRSILARLPSPVNILNIFDASNNFLQCQLFSCLLSNIFLCIVTYLMLLCSILCYFRFFLYFKQNTFSLTLNKTIVIKISSSLFLPCHNPNPQFSGLNLL